MGLSNPSLASKSAITIREVTPADYGAIVALWRELMDLHQSLSPQFLLSEDADDRFIVYLETALERPDYHVHIAEIDGMAVGFYVACVLPNSPVYRSRNVGYINDLCVTSTRRRQGVGRLLVQDAVQWLKGHEADSIELYVAEGNEGGIRFWEEVGAKVYLRRLSLVMETHL